MPNHCRGCRIVSTFTTFFLTLARKNAKKAVTVAITLLFAFICLAQDQPQTLPPSSKITAQASAKIQSSTVTIPGGTPFALVLTNPVSSKTMHQGDVVYAQTTAPVTVGEQVLIPAGTFMQGKVDKVPEMLMKSASVVFPDGYVANIAGPLSVQSDEGTAWRDPSDGARAGTIIAPLAGAGLGAAIGAAAHTTQSSTLGGTTITSSSPKGIMIGSMVGVAAGIVVSVAILLHSRHFFVDVGSPMEMTLPQPLTLSDNRVADSVRWAQEHPVAAPMAAPRPLPYSRYDRGTCYTSNGTPYPCP
jgi:hypothetical protein